MATKQVEKVEEEEEEAKIMQLSHEQLRTLVATYKDKYDKTRKYALQLEQKHQRSVTRERRLLVDHQKQVLQAETLNMMTKYQLVFAKIECQVNRVLNTNKLRELNILQRSFNKMRQNVQQQHLQQNYAAHMINLRFRSNVGVNMLNRYESKRVSSIRKAFELWRLASDAAKVMKRMQEVIQAELTSKKSQNVQLVDALKQKQAELKNELAHQQELQKRHESVRLLISEAEEKLAQEQNLAQSRLSERSHEANQQNEEAEQQQLALLREKEELHEQLINENKKLKANLTACEGNLSGFIMEMNALLDQHELGSLLGAALMPQDPQLGAQRLGQRGNNQANRQRQRQQQQNHEQTSNEGDQVYSSQHDSINERPQQRNPLGETGGGP